MNLRKNVQNVLNHTRWKDQLVEVVVAELTDSSPGIVRVILKYGSPQLSTLARWAQALGVSVSVLIDNCDGEPDPWKGEPDFAFSVRRLAERQGLTISALGRRMKRSPQEMNGVLQRNNPRVSIVREFARALRAPVGELVAPRNRKE